MSKPDARVEERSLKVGDKVKFENEKQAYTVKAADSRFAVCTKPFNPKRTVIYTIVDFKRNVRGTENLIFCFGFETQKGCDEALERLQKEESEVSYRNFIPLNIESVTTNAKSVTNSTAGDRP